IPRGPPSSFTQLVHTVRNSISFSFPCASAAHLDQCTDPANDLARPIAVLHDTAERLPSLLDIRALRAQPAQTGMGIGDRSGDGLVHFMSDRGGELPHCCDTVGVRELPLNLAISVLAFACFCFGPLTLVQIEHEGNGVGLVFKAR